MSIGKRLFPALATGFMAIVLTACGGSSSSGGSDSAGGTPVETPIAPSITTQPADQTAITGQMATFLVKATGTSLSYQWKKNGTHITGATSSSYTTPATSSADSGAKYSVSVSNSVSSVTSNTATLTVSDTAVAPAITTQPAAQSVTQGQTATFLVKASGTSLQYQWKKGGTDIPDATFSTYTTPATSMGDSGGVFTVVVSNALGTVTSSSATLTVTAAAVAPTITTQPAAQAVAPGQTASFSVVATGTEPLAYQWQKNGTNIDGATTNTYTTPATSIADIGAALAYSVVVTNSAGTVTSNNASLAVLEAPAITVQPTAPSAITAGQTATFSVTATGTGVTYQWKKNGVNITGGSGATTNTYTTPAMGYAGNGAEYSVEVRNGVGTVTSNSARLTVTKTSTLKSYGQVANASDGLYDKTECVQDNNTGLVWEGKNPSGSSSRDVDATYTNYDSTAFTQKPGSVKPTQAEIDASSNSIGYKNSVNASSLCGYTDWRMPTYVELQGILDASLATYPLIDITWFPYTQSTSYWTSTPTSLANSYNQATLTGFYLGHSSIQSRNKMFPVRLVRASQ